MCYTVCNSSAAPHFRLVFHSDHGSTFRPPGVDEISAVYPDNVPLEKDMVAFPRDPLPGSHLEIFPWYHPSADSLYYWPMLPKGHPGWSSKLVVLDLTENGQFEERHVTPREYYAAMIAHRPWHFNSINNMGRLFQEYVVEAAVKIQSYSIGAIRKIQTQLRVEEYTGLLKYVTTILQKNLEAQGNHDFKNAKVGRMVLLPQSFPGSARDMHRRYQDAMTMVGDPDIGKADYFITMTCNPLWPEIQDQLKKEPYHESAENRPDLICRVFRLKLKALMRELLGQKGQKAKAGIFGEVVAHVYAIEFQKRGLPHAHILLIMAKKHKITTAAQIDRCVSASIPDPENELLEYPAVGMFMVHHPCHPGSVCWKKGKCSKGFPKPFQAETIADNNGYALYKRIRPEDGGFTATINWGEGPKKVDDSWVVPHNRYLTVRFQCHINVEVCAGLTSIKYLHKYLTKGVDMQCFKIEKVNPDGSDYVYDEATQYETNRCMTPAEGALYYSDSFIRLCTLNLSAICYSCIVLHL